MIDHGECGAVVRMRIAKRNRSTRRKPPPVPLRPPQIPHDLTRARTCAAAVGSWRPVAWAMARPIWVVAPCMSLKSQPTFRRNMPLQRETTFPDWRKPAYCWGEVAAVGVWRHEDTLTRTSRFITAWIFLVTINRVFVCTGRSFRPGFCAAHEEYSKKQRSSGCCTLCCVSGRMIYCNYGTWLTHTPPLILISVTGLDQIHCASRWERSSRNTWIVRSRHRVTARIDIRCLTKATVAYLLEARRQRNRRC
jgi:hypothetical protein